MALDLVFRTEDVSGCVLNIILYFLMQKEEVTLLFLNEKPDTI